MPTLSLKKNWKLVSKLEDLVSKEISRLEPNITRTWFDEDEFYKLIPLYTYLAIQKRWDSIALLDDLVAQKNWHFAQMLEKMALPETSEPTINKMFFHLMMDKLLAKELEAYESANTDNTVHTLLYALNSLLKHKDVLSDDIVIDIFEQLTQKLGPYFMNSPSFGLYPKDISLCQKI